MIVLALRGYHILVTLTWGIVAAIAVKLQDPVFESQTKNKLGTADVRGWLRAEVCDIFGRKFEGFHQMDSDKITGDSHDHVLTWGGKDTSQVRYKPVPIRFELSAAEVDGVKY